MFWADRAKEYLQWEQPFNSVVEGDPQSGMKWFGGGKINVSGKVKAVHNELNCIKMLDMTTQRVASFPGSRAWEEEREPGTHCSRMRQVPLVTCILLRYTKITVNSVYLQKGSTAWLYSF